MRLKKLSYSFVSFLILIELLVKDDVIYFHPLKYYKIKNKGQEPFKFICTIIFLK